MTRRYQLQLVVDADQRIYHCAQDVKQRIEEILTETIDRRADMTATVSEAWDEGIRAILTVTNKDEVSGTTTFDNGTKAFWCEGRSSDVVIIEPGGRHRVINASDRHPAMEALSQDPGVTRAATHNEEHEHWVMRTTMGYIRAGGQQ